MSGITSLSCVEKKYSYQHLQGMMLLNLNKVASKIKLSHSEYRVICTLIGLYNKNYNKAFPTIEYLAKVCIMGKTTIIKSLNRLVEVNLLIVVKTPGKRNNYYFSNLILKDTGTPHEEPNHRTPCRTTHDNKQIKTITDQKTTSSIKINDAMFKTFNIDEYRQLITKLESWNYFGAKKIIKIMGIQKIQEIITIVESKKPKNKGAYLRSLLKLSDIKMYPEIKTSLSLLECTQIEQMLKYQFWKHIPTGKIYKTIPDIGNHLLIRYHKDAQMVEFLEYNLTDKLENFQVLKTNDSN